MSFIVLRWEVAVLKTINHPNIVQYRDLKKSTGPLICPILELLRRLGKFSEIIIIWVASQQMWGYLLARKCDLRSKFLERNHVDLLVLESRTYAELPVCRRNWIQASEAEKFVNFCASRKTEQAVLRRKRAKFCQNVDRTFFKKSF